MVIVVLGFKGFDPSPGCRSDRLFILDAFARCGNHSNSLYLSLWVVCSCTFMYFQYVLTDVTGPSYVHVWPGKLAKSVLGIIQVVS